MSSSSVVGQAGSAIGITGSSNSSLGISLPNFNNTAAAIGGYALGGLLGSDAGGIKNTLTPPKASIIPPDANSSTPTTSAANTTVLQSQLASEAAASVYAVNFTSGEGLLDQPTTASQVLLGS